MYWFVKLHGLLDGIMESIISLPGWLAVLIISALPILELRGGIPLAMGLYSMSPTKSFLLSVVGNTIPVLIMLKFLPLVEEELRKIKTMDRFFEWTFERIRQKVKGKLEKYGIIGLIPFVAIPLPVTGAWTGIAAAYIFDLRYFESLLAIFIGIIIAGTLVTLSLLGIFTLFGFSGM